MIDNVKNPRWENDAKEKIIVDAELDGQAIEYVASPTDCEQFGKDLHTRCLAGEFGEIGDPIPPKTEREYLEDSYNTSDIDCLEFMCDLVDDCFKTVKLLAGFEFNGKRIQTDEAARNNAVGYLNALVAGSTEILPIVWKTEDNEYLIFTSFDEYKPFATLFITFVKDAYASMFMAKDAIRAATSFEDAWNKYNAYKTMN